MKPAAIVLASCLIIFFFPILFGKVFFFADTLTFFYPHRHVASLYLKQGKLPTWNPYIFTGTPLLADAATGSLSPFMWLYLVLPTVKAITASTLLALFISGLGMFSFLRLITNKVESALLGSLVWVLSGSLMERTNNVVIIETLAFIPWIFFCIQKYITTSQSRWLIAGAVALSFAIYAGYLPLIILFSIVVTTWFMSVSKEKMRKRIITITSVFILAASVASLQLVPFIEFYSHSSRKESHGELNVHDHLHLEELPRLVLAKIYGAKNQGNSWGINAPPETGFASTDGYISLVALIILLTNYQSLIKKEKTWGLLALGSLLVSLGHETPIGRIYAAIPFINGIKPYQSLVVYTFTATILLAKTIAKPKHIPLAKQIIVVAGGMSLCAVLALALRTPLSFLINFFIPHVYSQAKIAVILKPIFLNLSLAGVITSLTVVILNGTTVFFQKRSSAQKVSLLTILVFFDYFLLGRGSLFLGDQSVFDAESRVVSSLTQTATAYRFLSVAGSQAYSDLDPLFNQWWVQEPLAPSHMINDQSENLILLNQKVRELPPNLGAIYGLHTINGYAGQIYLPYLEYWEKDSVNKMTVDLENIDRLNNLSIKYLVAPSSWQSKGNWQQILTVDKLALYENKDAKPLAHFERGHGEVTIQENSLSQLILYTSNQTPSSLIISIPNYPGWQAFIDNQKTPISITNRVFQRITIPEGEHQITLTFDSQSVKTGLVVSVVGALITLVLLVFPKFSQLFRTNTT